MTPEQQAYYDNELREIRSGGYGHEAYVVKAIHGLGGYIGPVDHLLLVLDRMAIRFISSTYATGMKLKS